jgi:N-acetylmuramoyl-L-alanine amidase
MSLFQKKIASLVIVIIFIVILDTSYNRVKKALYIPGSNKVVIIDAGHGGIDPGAKGKGGLIEKDVNLDIAKKLKRFVEEGGGVAIMIREEDEGLYSQDSPNKKREDMKNRKQIIKDSSGDIFISIHINSFPESRYYGAQVFYFKNQKESMHLAKIMQQELIRVLNRNNERVEKSTEDYFILKDNEIPSVLIECGFLSNSEEEKLLLMPEYQEKIAFSIYTGIIRFFSEPMLDDLSN